MNELINHEAVYRTAPATPGLLIISQPRIVVVVPGYSLTIWELKVI